jgi:hypothetical protein
MIARVIGVVRVTRFIKAIRVIAAGYGIRLPALLREFLMMVIGVMGLGYELY